MGEANDLTQVIDAAALPTIAATGASSFVLQGDGKRRAGARGDVRRREPRPTSSSLPAGDKRAAARLAAASDACMTIFKDVPILATNSPNKLFDTFAAGRPAIVNTDGWQRTLVEEHEAGLFARPGDAADLAAQVRIARRRSRARTAASAPTRERSPSASSTATCSPGGCAACSSAPRGASRDRRRRSPTASSTPTAASTCSPAWRRSTARTPPASTREVLVLDNCSDDGSVAAVEQSPHDARVIALDRRAGKAENDSRLLRGGARRATACCSTRTPSCAPAPRRRCSRRSRRTRAPRRRAPSCCRPRASAKACAWRLPGSPRRSPACCSCTSCVTTQSGGRRTRRVGWMQSSAMLVRREAAAAVDYLDPDFFVYSDETDFCKRLHDAGWQILYVPAAEAVHHDQLTTDLRRARRRIVEFHRNRDLYMRKHHGTPARLLASGARRRLLPRARAGRRAAARPRCAPLPVPCPAGAVARPRRGHPRGRRGVQPPSANRTVERGSSTLPAPPPPCRAATISVDHPALANIACLIAAAGVALLLAGRGRAMVVGGLLLIGLARCGAGPLRLGDRQARRADERRRHRSGRRWVCWCSGQPPRCWFASRPGCRWRSWSRHRCDRR